jgi:hypothetical protein
MLGIEIVGFIASGCIVLSLTMRSMVPLRLIGLVGSLAFVVYGVVLGAWPIVVTNAAASTVQLFHLWSLFTRSANDATPADSTTGSSWPPPEPNPRPAVVGPADFIDPSWSPPGIGSSTLAPSVAPPPARTGELPLGHPSRAA